MPYKDIKKRRTAYKRWAKKNPERLKIYQQRWRKSDYYKLNRQQEGLNKKYRRKLLKERGNICEYCNKVSNVDMHHIDSDNRNNSEKNLILLCRICHRKRHKK